MKDDEKFAIWLAGAALRSADQEIDALTLDDLARQVEQNGNLESELVEMRRFDRRGGDFGAEIIGAVVVPILIEAGKQLWATYLKKLTDKAAGKLADVTADEVSALIKQTWATPGDDSRASYERILQAEAAKQGLSQSQTEGLIAALNQRRMADEVAKV